MAAPTRTWVFPSEERHAIVPVELFFSRLLMYSHPLEIDRVSVPDLVYVPRQLFIDSCKGSDDEGETADQAGWAWDLFGGLLPVGEVLMRMYWNGAGDPEFAAMFTSREKPGALAFLQTFFGSAKHDQVPQSLLTAIQTEDLRAAGSDSLSLTEFRVAALREIAAMQFQADANVLLPHASLPVIPDRTWIACAALAWRTQGEVGAREDTLLAILRARGAVSLPDTEVALFVSDLNAPVGGFADRLHQQLGTSLQAIRRAPVPLNPGGSSSDPWEIPADATGLAFWATPWGVRDYLARISAMHLIERMSTTPYLQRRHTLANFGRWLVREVVRTVGDYILRAASTPDVQFEQLPVPVYLEEYAGLRAVASQGPAIAPAVVAGAGPGAAGAPAAPAAPAPGADSKMEVDAAVKTEEVEESIRDCVRVALVWFSQLVFWASKTPGARYGDDRRVFVPFLAGETFGGLTDAGLLKLRVDDRRVKWLGAIVREAAKDLAAEAQLCLVCQYPRPREMLNQLAATMVSELGTQSACESHMNWNDPTWPALRLNPPTDKAKEPLRARTLRAMRAFPV